MRKTMRKTRGKRSTFRKMFGGVHENTHGISTANKRRTLRSVASAFFKPLTSVFKPEATGENFKNKNGIYEGELNDKGQRHGKGIMRYENGDVYEGDWKDGKMQGKGTMTNKKGAEYSARWKDGIRKTTPMYKMYPLKDANNVTIGWTTIPKQYRLKTTINSQIRP